MLTNQPLPTADAFLQAFRDNYRRDEDAVIEALLPQAKIEASARARAWERARELVIGIRRAQTGKGGVDALLNEFSLSTEEGIVLMCLAEALLRVPDKKTTDSLIRDKLTQGDWSSHLGHSDSLFVNASAWGLLLTGKVVSYKAESKDTQQQLGLLKKTVNRFGEPVIRSAVRFAMQIMGTQFVMGKTIASALKRAEAQEGRGYRYSYDMLGEGARTQAAAERYFQSYLDAIHSIGKAAKGRGPVESPGISVKLSAIHPRYEYSHRERVLKELVPQLKALALVAKHYDIGFTVDAEEADRLELSVEIIEAVFADKDLQGWDGFGLAVQAYQKRALLVVDWARDLCKKVGRKMMVRLVKGAYWDSEIKWSQEEGLSDYPVFTRKPSTDVSYQACAKKLLAAREYLYPQFATHNAYTVATILEMDDDITFPAREGYEFQRLHGMGEALYDQVLEKESVSCRIYAPVGEHADLLAYLVRRLLENGANSSFVNNIVDESIPVESLLQDPVEQVEQWAIKRNQSIPKPLDILAESTLEAGTRQNSLGVELSDVNTLAELKASMEQWWQRFIDDSNASVSAEEGDLVKVLNPANRQEQVGHIQFADEATIEDSLLRAENAFSSWSATPVAERAALLRRLADELEKHHAGFMALCTKEAGKTIADGVAEVREAVDFCRYYADRAEELMADSSVQARGVILCISPWNFPLAIFLGQVAAALVTGNTVVAKPAEQTSLVAIETVKLMHACGFPPGVVELLVAPGKPVGEKLVPDTRIQGVMFTGSTDTGRWLSKTLANRDAVGIPLVAETGGQNAMIVDSTALPEQVVDDVIQSGFQSAGQRCSALRVLFLQDDVADKIITMIKGAMNELHIGDPALLSTDVGPVIDGKALARLHDHVDDLATQSTRAKLLHKIELPKVCESGSFFAPHLFELDDLSVLKQEVFGPVVHVVRFKSGKIDSVIDQINASGFGLTLGVHSRIESVCGRVAEKAQVGNVYVNRNMIGAIVGVQPFGGCGLSGTGPKAGGPHYLTRLVKDIESTAMPGLEYVHSPEIFKPGIASANLPSKDIQAAQLQWAALPVTQRGAIMRSLLSYLANNAQSAPELTDLIDWIQPQLDLLTANIDRHQVLPGPTGETNQLGLRARGVLAALLTDEDNFDDSVNRVLVALLAGNAVVWLVAEQHQAQAETIVNSLHKAGLNESVITLGSMSCAGDLLASDLIDGALVNQGSACAHWVQMMLAEREGALLPLITETRIDFLLPRLQLEKTVTVDTTAAGGNASLMTMEA